MTDSPSNRAAGFIAIAGAVSMFAGAGLYGASGTDLFAALAQGTMEAHLAAVTSVTGLLVANAVFWILGVLLLGIAGTLMADLSPRSSVARTVGLVSIRSGVPLAVASFLIMLAVTMQTPSLEVATVVGWMGARMDDVATFLIAGVGPLMFSIAGSGAWVPRWLGIWGMLAGVAGLVYLLSMFVPSLSTAGFMIVPVGLGWMVAAGVVLVRERG